MTKEFSDKIYDVEVLIDIPYGPGGIGFVEGQGASRYRTLNLDVYKPVTSDRTLRPALIMAFGGAFHRGSKGVEEFSGENPSTAVAEYCREFARRGYICFSIDYRLMQEDPDPGCTPFLFPDQPQSLDRINFVRNLMGFPPCTNQMMANTLEAATDDMSKAVAFVRSQSRVYGVDIDRIAIGGFSAGAGIALNSAFAENAPVAAVVALSGWIAGVTLDASLETRPQGVPTLLFYGEEDLPAILAGVDNLRDRLRKANVSHTIVPVRDQNHFYVRTATHEMPGGRTSDVETTIAAFLYEQLRLGDGKAAAVVAA